MRKKYLKLTKDQKERGIIFSSQLIVKKDSEVKYDFMIHEVHQDDKDKDLFINNLLNDSFFDSNTDISHNEIRR